MKTYKIPDEHFFRLHHVRPRFKNDVESVLIHVATSIANINKTSTDSFNNELNSVIRQFGGNQTSTTKTIDNWRTEISALFGLIDKSENHLLKASRICKLLAKNQYLDQFFNYFLFTFQYPGGHVKPRSVVEMVNNQIKFKPCFFILSVLKHLITSNKSKAYITPEEATFCIFNDKRVTSGQRGVAEVANVILENRKNKVDYFYDYNDLFNVKTKSFPSRGDIVRYAGDILDYMVLGELLDDKTTGQYYSLNKDNQATIDFHINNVVWFDEYDKYYISNTISLSDARSIEVKWNQYVNSFYSIPEFEPNLTGANPVSIAEAIETYYSGIKGKKNVSTKETGDLGESLIIAHEILRTQPTTKRQHLINKIPTHLGVGFDIQSIEGDKIKRYIEVKTTKSKKSLKTLRFNLTPNELDSALTLREKYFIYYLRLIDNSNDIFVIKDPIKQIEEGHLKLSQHLVVEFNENAGKWTKLLQITNLA